jgi:hypothetical protein
MKRYRSSSNMGAARLLLEKLLPLDLENLLKMTVSVIFSVMVSWIQRMFGIQMYHEGMQVKFEYGCGPIIIGEVIALGLRKLLENDSFCSFVQ